MTINNYPRLCGGTFFVLVLQALQPRMKAKEHYSQPGQDISDLADEIEERINMNVARRAAAFS